MRQKDLRPAPALIEYKGMKFLITDRPSDITINHYIMVSIVNTGFVYLIIYVYSLLNCGCAPCTSFLLTFHEQVDK